MAARTRRGRRNPIPTASWIRANPASNGTGCCATRRARKSTAGDPCWLARPGRRQHLPGEGRGEHERLQLQHRVHQPQHPRVTWIPRRVAGGHRNRYPAAQPAPRVGTATLVAVEPVIRAVRDRGVTTLLVTHDMQEAQHLCDQVALLDAGRTVATDTPAPGRTGRRRQARALAASAAFDESGLSALPEVSSLEHDRGLVVVTGEGDLANAVILTLGKVGVSARRPPTCLTLMVPRAGKPSWAAQERRAPRQEQSPNTVANTAQAPTPRRSRYALATA